MLTLAQEKRHILKQGSAILSVVFEREYKNSAKAAIKDLAAGQATKVHGRASVNPQLALNQLREQLVVRFVLLKGGDEGFHGLNRVEVDHSSAQLADGVDLVLGKEFFLFARAAFGNVDGREQTAIGKLAVENELHVAGAFEFLEDEFIHPGAGVNERGGQNGERTAFFNLSGGGKHLAGNFEGARVHTAGHGAAAAAVNAVVCA